MSKITTIFKILLLTSRENYLNELSREDSKIVNIVNSDIGFYSNTALERWIPETSAANTFDLSEYYFAEEYEPM